MMFQDDPTQTPGQPGGAWTPPASPAQPTSGPTEPLGGVVPPVAPVEPPVVPTGTEPQVPPVADEQGGETGGPSVPPTV